MDVPLYIVIGRSDDCDVVLPDSSVSGRHARLSWRGSRILVEDLGSANGTWVDGRKVRRAELRPGAEVGLGNATLSWSDPSLKAFLRRGARGDTLVAARIPGRRFICGSCGSRGIMPPGFTRGQLKCGSCGVELQVGARPRRGWVGVVVAVTLLAAGAGLGVWILRGARGGDGLRQAAERLGLSQDPANPRPAASSQERSIRERIAPQVVEAIDSNHPVTRNAAVRIAADEEGPFRMEQVAAIWSTVRREWDYVNDPRGREFFASASQSIDNGYAGDCDDFAIVLSAMIEAIGGESRIVMLDGDQGGHAYAEVCLHEPPEEVAQRLARYYRGRWDRYLGRQELENIHFRSSPSCPVWLNLDWNARVPGGPYGQEYWAVSIYPDGRTETLAAAGGPAVDPTEPPETPLRPSATPSR